MESLIEEHSIVPRSCWNCRRKKVKCDRKEPCATCVRLQVKCTYPEIERRKHARPALVSALLGRLSELESQISTRSEGPENPQESTEIEPKPPPTSLGLKSRDSNGDTAFLLDQGGHGESRFFSDNFISNLLAENKDNVLNISPVNYNASTMPTITASSAWSFDLPDSNTMSTDAQRAINLWQVFVANFHPLTQVVHLPTCQTRFLAALLDQNVEESQRFLVAAICFAGTITIDHADVFEKFGCDRSILLQSYRDQAESYVGKFSLLTRPNLEYVQALMIFIIALRSIDSTRAVWILTGIALRTAQSLGLHVDGKTMGLKPFECEVRRKVWWQLFMLEVRTAEDHGLLVGDISSTTNPPHYPSNLNDIDLWPEMPAAPEVSDVSTSSTLIIIWIRLFQEILHPALAPLQTEGTTILTVVEQRRQRAREAYVAIGNHYFSTDEHRNQPYYPAGFALWRFSIAKADFLILFQAYQRPNLDNKEIIRQETVISALNVVEGVVRAQANQGMKQFQWYARSNRQWFAIGFLLQQLSKGFIQEDDLQQRAHSALDILFSVDDDEDQSLLVQRRGAVWIAMKLLRTKALYSNRSSPANTLSHLSECSATPEYLNNGLFDQIFDIDQSAVSDYGFLDAAMFVQ